MEKNKKLLLFIFAILFAFVSLSCDFKGNKKEPTEVNNDPTEPVEPNKDNEQDPDPTVDPTVDIEPSSTYVEIKFNYDDEKLIASSALKEYDLSYDSKGYEKYTNEITSIIENKKGIEALNKAFDNFSAYSGEIYDKYILLEMLYYAGTGSKTIDQEYLDLYEYVLFLSDLADKINYDIANSIYAKDFFTGYTEEEIISIAQTEINNDELNQLLLKKVELADQFAEEYKQSEIDKILKKYISTNKEIAVLCGYERDEYIKYSDAYDYFRQYTEDDINLFIANTLNFIVDLAINTDMSYEIEDEEENTKYETFKYGKFFDNRELFDDYAKEVGGLYNDTYIDLWDSGYYLFSSYFDSYGVAFENKGDNVSLVFFGRGVHDLSSVAHEFGHYYTSSLNTDNCSYDLCETHSQSSEILLRLYLSEKYPGYASTIYEYEFVRGLLLTIIDGAMLREFEQTVYSSDVTSLRDTWNTILSKYSYLSSSDMYELIIDYDNYYISYATSALASLLVYAYGKENGFDKACELYKGICSYDGYGDIEEALASVNLRNPFEEETFIYIKNIIEQVQETEWNQYKK